jgi:alpha-beta hydrolase superfamily lysophospholipase
MGYHVLAFDYRGYGSSTYVKPNESTLVSDAQTAWNWLQGMNKNGSAKVVVHGHSLGTGVASKLANILVGKGNVCDY